MRQLDEAFHRPATKDRAEASLQRLAISLFGQGMNSEEADFVAEMLKGVSPAVAGRVRSLFETHSASLMIRTDHQWWSPPHSGHSQAVRSTAADGGMQ